MSGKTVSGIIPSHLHRVAQDAAEYEGVSLSALVSQALAFYLQLPAAARRTARHVLTSGPADARNRLLDGCSRAIARAGDDVLRARLAAAGNASGFTDQHASDDAIEQEAIDAVRQAQRRAAKDPVASG